MHQAHHVPRAVERAGVRSREANQPHAQVLSRHLLLIFSYHSTYRFLKLQTVSSTMEVCYRASSTAQSAADITQEGEADEHTRTRIIYGLNSQIKTTKRQALISSRTKQNFKVIIFILNIRKSCKISGKKKTTVFQPL